MKKKYKNKIPNVYMTYNYLILCYDSKLWGFMEFEIKYTYWPFLWSFTNIINDKFIALYKVNENITIH
jgi:hypothetical protein